MALIACPDCGKEVSDAASVCIHCGRPIASDRPRTYEPGPPPTYEPDTPRPAPATHPGRDLRAAKAKRNATITYALHALSFLVGITGLVALVLGYVFRSDARGTWVESHFTWQIRTFWWGVLAMVGLTVMAVGLSLSGHEATMLAGVGATTLGVFVVIGWAIYRVGRGWIRLERDEPI